MTTSKVSNPNLCSNMVDPAITKAIRDFHHVDEIMVTPGAAMPLVCTYPGQAPFPPILCRYVASLSSDGFSIAEIGRRLGFTEFVFTKAAGLVDGIRNAIELGRARRRRARPRSLSDLRRNRW